MFELRWIRVEGTMKLEVMMKIWRATKRRRIDFMVMDNRATVQVA